MLTRKPLDTHCEEQSSLQAVCHQLFSQVSVSLQGILRVLLPLPKTTWRKFRCNEDFLMTLITLTINGVQ